jgi:hypothetical protein
MRRQVILASQYVALMAVFFLSKVLSFIPGKRGKRIVTRPSVHPPIRWLGVMKAIDTVTGDRVGRMFRIVFSSLEIYLRSGKIRQERNGYLINVDDGKGGTPSELLLSEDPSCILISRGQFEFGEKRPASTIHAVMIQVEGDGACFYESEDVSGLLNGIVWSFGKGVHFELIRSFITLKTGDKRCMDCNRIQVTLTDMTELEFSDSTPLKW